MFDHVPYSARKQTRVVGGDTTRRRPESARESVRARESEGGERAHLVHRAVGKGELALAVHRVILPLPHVPDVQRG